jgi:hypothetical protein
LVSPGGILVVRTSLAWPLLDGGYIAGRWFKWWISIYLKEGVEEEGSK